MAVVGLYCHFHAQQEESTTSMLGSSFKQLATREGIPEYMQEQCSQRSGAPVGPDGGTAKSPGPDGTAKCGPHPSWKPQDGRLCGGRRALQGKTF